MLTREHAIARIEDGIVVPDRLIRSKHAHYSALAKSAARVYEEGRGRTRRELHSAIHRVFANELDCPIRRIDSFCKLLDERGTFEMDEKGLASKLRREVFRKASAHHPLVSHVDKLFGNAEFKVKDLIASSFSKSWMELQEGMFRDLIENHTLLEFQSFATPVELLSRYNIAQTQVALFDAVEVIVQMREDFKSIVRYAKLARLMHRIQRTSDGYRIALDGPASLLQNTSRYGVSMAKFLPGLLSCRGWSLSASIRKPKWGRLRLLLDAECGLNSSVVAPSEFDSSVEEKFYERWKNADTLGWTIERETEILSQGQSVFFPDFVFRHQDGRVAMMEIIGFWTPEYLEHKRKSLSLFPKDNLFFAIHQSIDSPSLQIEERRVLRYKTSISVETVLRTLREAMK